MEFVPRHDEYTVPESGNRLYLVQPSSPRDDEWTPEEPDDAWSDGDNNDLGAYDMERVDTHREPSGGNLETTSDSEPEPSEEPESTVIEESPVSAHPHLRVVHSAPSESPSKPKAKTATKAKRSKVAKKPETPDGWPPKQPGYVWLNKTKSGVSLYRSYGTKLSRNKRKTKNIKYVCHFTWSYLEEKYGKPDARYPRANTGT